MDNPIEFIKAWAIALKNNWLIKKGNPLPNIKAWIKKIVDTKKNWLISKSRPKKSQSKIFIAI